MKGHIRPYKDKDGKIVPNVFHLVVPIGKYKSGKTRYKWYTYHGQKRDAENHLASLVNEVTTPTFAEPTKMTVLEFMNFWLNKLKTKQNPIAEGTAVWYQSLIDNHIEDEIGAVPLSKLSPIMVQNMIDSADSIPLARGIYRTLRAALNRAVQWRYIKENPVLHVEAPEAEEKNIRYLTIEEIWKFLDESKKYRNYGIYLTALTTAMRKREICGLRWANVDLEGRIIFVEEALRKAGRQTSFKPLKSKKSRRMIPMASILVEELKRIKELREKEIEECCGIKGKDKGGNYEDYDLVFTIPGGRPMDPDHLSQREFKDILKAVDLPYDQITIHGLRHSTATLLSNLGVDKRVIADICGHADDSTTDIYIHRKPDIKKQKLAINKLDREISRKHKKGQAL